MFTFTYLEQFQDFVKFPFLKPKGNLSWNHSARERCIPRFMSRGHFARFSDTMPRLWKQKDNMWPYC